MSQQKQAARAASRDAAVPEVYREMLAEVRAEAASQGTALPERSLKRKRPGEGRRTKGFKETPAKVVKLSGAGSGYGLTDDTSGNEDIEFEDVLPKPTVQTMERESDEDDNDEIDFEDVTIEPAASSSAAAPGQVPSKPLNLDLSTHMAALVQRRADRRKAISREEKERRVEVHKIHLVCLLAHVEIRNRWCSDPRVHDILRPLLPQKTVAALNPRASLNQFSRTESLKKGLQEAKELFRYQLPDDMDSTLEKSDFLEAAKTLQGSRDVGAQLFCALLRAQWHPVDPFVTNTQWKPKSSNPASDTQNILTYAIAFSPDGSARDVTRRYAKAYTSKTRKSRVDNPTTTSTTTTKSLLNKSGPKWYTSLLHRYTHSSHSTPRTKSNSQRSPPRKRASPCPATWLTSRTTRSMHWNDTCDGTRRLFPGHSLWGRGSEDEGEEDVERVGLFGDEAGGNMPLFMMEQTELYVAPPVRDGRVPKNKFGNLDLYVPSMVPPGGLHIAHERAGQAAFVLGVDYAPALTRFEFKGRHGTAVYNGVVVPEEAGEAVWAVVHGLLDMDAEEEEERRTRRALRMWSRFLKALRIRERIWANVDEEAEAEAEEEKKESKGKGKEVVEDEDVAMEDVESEEDMGGGGFFVPDEEEDDGGGGGGGGFIVE
ncbi:hypothetical protein N0V88_005464 [Collariella sp. IMI 366227]|nr:hypothetical protein N0V88_005464 [Collariella sp. IMI 366227]